ncbi:MAG: DUF3822 family protein [Bacteroidales bacterium]|nr:DUF3822 family protein [Bacteroidales bacterium]
MKSVLLLYGKNGFQALNRPGSYFSSADFQAECVRQQLIGDTQVVLRIIFHCEHFLVLPRVADQQPFFDFQYPQQAGAVLCSRELGDGMQKIVYDLNLSLKAMAEKTLPHYHLLPDAYLFARYCMNISRKAPIMFVYWQSDSLDIFTARNGQLGFANHFEPKTEEEARYFILSVKQTFGDEKDCIFCTEIPDENNAAQATAIDSLTKRLSPYFESFQRMNLCQDIKAFLENISDEIL